MTEQYRYDDQTLQRVTDLLYQAIPAMYRVPDQPPTGSGELERFTRVLATPLAVVRQAIEELHADLFIDTAADGALAHLAEMVGTTLVFPDADSNRRDVRGTVAWRRRKGTPAALEEMANELTGKPVVVQEGWQQVQVAQDLNTLRLARTSVDIRPAVVAEQVTGPLDVQSHSVDVRPPTATQGRRHPLHVSNWVHTTLTYPLVGATAVDVGLPTSDQRYEMRPYGGPTALRARRASSDGQPFTDRILEMHFRADPGRWFGQPGGFTINVCDLPAAVVPEPIQRHASTRTAHASLGRGEVSISLLDRPTRGWRGPVNVEFGLATATGLATPQWRPNPATFAARASIDLDAGGEIGNTSTGGATPGGIRMAMLRLAPSDGAPGRFFPGCTVEIASAAAGATAIVDDAELGAEGFLRGALHVEIPAMNIDGERFLHIAADGSLYEAAQPDGTLIEMPVVDGQPTLAAANLAVAGPGSAFPATLPVAEPSMTNRLPGAVARGPAIMHGATVLRTVGSGFDFVAGTVDCALVFAAQIRNPGGATYRPFQGLLWSGSDPTTARWVGLDEVGSAASASAVTANRATIAQMRDEDPGALSLAARFLTSDGAGLMCPGEIAWTTDDGRTILIHLPQLAVGTVRASDTWPGAADLGFASEPIRVADDGSTWAADSTARLRFSMGSIAPTAGTATLQRRRVNGRRLCAWQNEDWSASPPQILAPTERGFLDVDVEHGLFSMSADEPAQQWPESVEGLRPPSVTSNHEEGATMHIGARPAARQPVLDAPLERPTRLVSRSGTHRANAPADWHEIPRYDSLSSALAAISTTWQALTSSDTVEPIAEIIQFDDSATYEDEQPVWPSAPTDPVAQDQARFRLVIQSAERERPVILVDPVAGWSMPGGVAAAYETLTLRGLALGGDGWSGLAMPPTSHVSIQFCSVLDRSVALTFADIGDGAEVLIERCELGPLVVNGVGRLEAIDTIIDVDGTAIDCTLGHVMLERTSIRGAVVAHVLDASETIFDGDVVAIDRFQGCVRFCRVTSNSQLPTVHNVVVDVPVRLVSHNRFDPAWWRLHESCDVSIRHGAKNGSEMGAFGSIQLSERVAGLVRRLDEYTPAGLVTGLILID